MDKLLVRSALVRVLFVAVLVGLVGLVGLVAPAQAAPPSPAAAAAAAAPALNVAGALFTPARTSDGVTWRAEWVLTPESAAELEGGATRTLRFALPLVDNATLDASPGLLPIISGKAPGPIRDGEQVTGLLVDRAALDGRKVRAVVQQPGAVADARVRLGAPVAAGTALQIIDADLGAGNRFEIDTGSGLERRVGHIAPPNVGHAAREEARRLTGYDRRVSGAPVFVRGDDVKAANGVHGLVVPPHRHARDGIVVLAGVFVALVSLLFAAVRRLRSAASVERADALLAAEVDALDTRDPREGDRAR